MLVPLLKKKGTYKDKEGKEKTFTNFYVKCGDRMIAVEPVYFPDPKNNDRDLGYAVRKGVLDSFADELPAKDE